MTAVSLSALFVTTRRTNPRATRSPAGALCRFLVAVLLALGATTALAQPANDNIANAELIAALPFTDTETAIGDATVEATDPLLQCRSGSRSPGVNTVWYRYVTGPTTSYITLGTLGSSYNTMIAVFTGTPGNLRPVSGACNEDGEPFPSDLARIAGLRLAPATTHWIMVSRSSAIALPATLNFSVAPSTVHVVSTTTDTADGACDAHCSLREAITAANASPGAIVLPAGTFRIGITGATIENLNASGDFDILAPAAIYGAGSAATIIDGQGLDRVLHVDPTNTSRVNFLLADVAVINGNAVGAPAGANGGGLAVGGAAMATVDRVVFRDNSVLGDGGAMSGAVHLRILDSTFSGNEAGGRGGALAADQAINVDIEIIGSTFVGNRSLATSSMGGGAISSRMELHIVNTTITGNRANFGGGGIHMTDSAGLSIANSTIAGNTADDDADGTGAGGGLRLDGNGGTTFRNSIIADNVVLGAGGGPDCSRGGTGGFVSSYTLVEQGDGGCPFSGTGDNVGVDPALLPLAANGGATMTRAIGVGPARDSGDPAGCHDTFGTPLANDQRGDGWLRAFNGTCDRGAFEEQPLGVLLKDGFE